MKTILLRKSLMAFAFLASVTMSAQQVYSFDADLEGWPAGGNAPNAFATSIAWDAGSGGNTGLAIIAPKENATVGTTTTVNTIMYGPGNDNVGNGGGFNADAYNYLKITLKNETAGTVLRVRCRRDDGASNAWTQQDFTITANDTDFKTYTFALNSAQWSGTNSDISILVRDTSGAWTPTTQVSVDRIEFFNFTQTDTFAGHIQNPGFDDVLGGDGVWNPQNKSFSTVSVTDEEFVDGFQSLKIAFDANQDAGGGGNIAAFGTTFGPLDGGGSYTSGTEVTLRAKVWVKYKRNPAATNPDKEITIQGNWKLAQNGSGTPGVKTNNVTQTVAHDVWTEFEFTATFDNVTFNGAQFRPIINNASALLQYETIYLDAMDSCDGCASLSTKDIVKDDASIRLFPNPVRDILNVEAEGRNISKIEVYSMLGKRVLTADNTKSINVSSLSRGVYISKIFGDDDSVSTKRFVKE